MKPTVRISDLRDLASLNGTKDVIICMLTDFAGHAKDWIFKLNVFHVLFVKNHKVTFGL